MDPLFARNNRSVGSNIDRCLVWLRSISQRNFDGFFVLAIVHRSTDAWYVRWYGWIFCRRNCPSNRKCRQTPCNLRLAKVVDECVLTQHAYFLSFAGPDRFNLLHSTTRYSFRSTVVRTKNLSMAPIVEPSKHRSIALRDRLMDSSASHQ